MNKEAGGPQYMGLQRVGHAWATNTTLGESRAIYWRRRWHPTPVLSPGKSHGRRRLVGCSSWGREESVSPPLAGTGRARTPVHRVRERFAGSCISSAAPRRRWRPELLGALPVETAVAFLTVLALLGCGHAPGLTPTSRYGPAPSTFTSGCGLARTSEHGPAPSFFLTSGRLWEPGLTPISGLGVSVCSVGLSLSWSPRELRTFLQPLFWVWFPVRVKQSGEGALESNRRDDFNIPASWWWRRNTRDQMLWKPATPKERGSI